jgi:hypothetical protein
MEINQRQQDKFSADNSTLWVDRVDGSRREIDYVEVEKAIKDFCFIRHELSNYRYLYASQMQFDIHLNLMYWEYLFVNGPIEKEDKDELEEGSLLTIYLFFKEIYEAFAQENYSNEKLSGQCIDKLDDQTEKLRNTLTENDNWVYFEFVEKYYIDKAKSFEPLRQNTKDFFESIKNGGQK